MERPSGPRLERFSTPAEELAYLREELARREDVAGRTPAAPPREALATDLVREHATRISEEVRAEAAAGAEVVLDISPEKHDEKMGELLHLLQEKGVSYAIASVESSRNPHLLDDFHRVLVAYVMGGNVLPRASERGPLVEALKTALFEVTLPSEVTEEEGKQRTLKELVSSMEQFYQGMRVLAERGREGHFALEIARPNGASHTSFFIAVPRDRADLFEKQVLGVFPDARIEARRDDYNVFAENGFAVASEAAFETRPIYALKTYDEFDYDPLNILLNAFSKIGKDEEGVAVQFIIRGEDRGLLKRFQKALERVRKGIPIGTATDVPLSGAGKTISALEHFFSPGKTSEERARRAESDPRVKNIEKKVKSPLSFVNIRVVASGKSPERAAAILRDVEASFRQFADTNGNSLSFKLVSRGAMREFVRRFSFRMSDASSALPLSTAELTTMAHLPPSGIRTAPEFKQSKAAKSPMPPGLPEEGVLIGYNHYGGQDKGAYLTDEDRLRHFYCIGQTGTGKSSLLKNMIVQDIQRGAGVCFIDPHGVDVLEILSSIPPERHQDVIYFDPGATERPMGLNMLEYDRRFPEQKTLVVDELLATFKKLFGAVPESMGPAFEQYFRNATLLVMEDPDSGNTLLDVGRVFANSAYRQLKLSRCRNPIVVQFWREMAEKAGGEQALENYAPWVTNKFDNFTANEIMRPIIAQEHSSFNFRDVMDSKKILLVNLAKGRVGDLNANLLGLIIVGKFLVAALSRVDSVGKSLPAFYLYIDEFQNFSTNSIATILSEARKYKLSLTIAHQFIAQLEEEIRDAVFGNVGSLCAFRVGPEDAEFLEKQFTPTFAAKDLMNIENREGYLRLLAGGHPQKPFSIRTPDFSPGTLETIDKLKEASYLRYGRDRAAVEREIMSRYEKKPVESAESLSRLGL